MGRRDDFWPFCGYGFKAGSGRNGMGNEQFAKEELRFHAIKMQKLKMLLNPFLKIKIIEIYFIEEFLFSLYQNQMVLYWESKVKGKKNKFRSRPVLVL